MKQKGRRNGRLAATAGICGVAMAIGSSGISSASLNLHGTVKNGANASTGSPPTTTTPIITYNTTSVCHPGAVPITFWGWVNGFPRAVIAFNKSHPKICVNMQNVGAGLAEYDKLTTAFSAGSGAPDVAEIEYYELPSFELTHDVLPLNSYGGKAALNTHILWAQREASQNGTIYGMPFDSGPMALLYNTKIYSKYHITPATTWGQFATEAVTLHKQDPNTYISNFWPEDGAWLLASMSQTDKNIFSWNGASKVTINFTAPAAMQFARFWQNLIDKNAVAMIDDSGTEYYAAMDNGLIASLPQAPWGPKGFEPAATKTLGDWRMAALPQWAAGQHDTVNWGGSTYAVTKQSKHPAQAAIFAEWLTSSEASWNILRTYPSLEFPSYKPLLHASVLANEHSALFGSQKFEVPFINQAGGLVYQNYPPFMTYILTEAESAFAPVVAHKETMMTALGQFQANVVAYAHQEGFTVTQ